MDITEYKRNKMDITEINFECRVSLFSCMLCLARELHLRDAIATRFCEANNIQLILDHMLSIASPDILCLHRHTLSHRNRELLGDAVGSSRDWPQLQSIPTLADLLLDHLKLKESLGERIPVRVSQDLAANLPTSIACRPDWNLGRACRAAGTTLDNRRICCPFHILLCSD